MLVIALCAALCLPTAPDTLEGTWEGAIEVVGQKIPLTVAVTAVGDGYEATVDLQGVTGLKLEDVSVEDSRVRFRLPAAPAGDFDGTWSGEEISGAFRQGAANGTFRLKRTLKGRPAGPAEPPVPYRVEEVTFRNGDVTLAGTLTLPEGEGPFPGVALITGSGAQNRDEEVFGFRPFRLIADHLTRRGMAVLRWDDRGIGGSGGTLVNATVEDLVGDVSAALDLLAGRSEVDGARLGLLGHSEGGLLAPLAARRHEGVAALVLMAGPAVPGSEVMLEQKRLILRSQLAPPERIELGTRVQEALFRAALTDQGWQEAARLVREELEASGVPEESRDSLVQSSLAGVQQPMMKFFLGHDPAEDLRRVSCPVLALYGANDLQVPAQQNAPVLEALWAEHPAATVTVLPTANHLFQASRNGSPLEYPSLEKEFVGGFLEAVGGFLEKHL